MSFWTTSLIMLAVFVQPTKQRFIVALAYAIIFTAHTLLIKAIPTNNPNLFAVYALSISAMIDLLILTFLLGFSTVNKMILRVSFVSLLSLLVNVGGIVTYLLSVQSLYYNTASTILAFAMIGALWVRNDDDMASNKGFNFNFDFVSHYHTWVNYIRENKETT